jgi:hypothetical protein
VLEKSGGIVGKVIFEMSAVSEKFKSKIIAFKDKTISLIKQVGVKVIEGYSAYKQLVKERQGIRSILKIVSFVSSHEVFNQVVNALQITIPVATFISPQDIIKGILLVADG